MDRGMELAGDGEGNCEEKEYSKFGEEIDCKISAQNSPFFLINFIKCRD